MSGQTRLHAGITHERAVAVELERRGYLVNQFGQGLFTDEMRAVLQTLRPPCPVRWLPDYIVTDPAGRRPCLVDPKTGRRDTGRHSIEQAALVAHSALEAAVGLRIAYVWWNLTGCWRDALRIVERSLPHDPRAGSGTPYVLVAERDQQSLDELFPVVHRPTPAEIFGLV